MSRFTRDSVRTAVYEDYDDLEGSYQDNHLVSNKRVDHHPAGRCVNCGDEVSNDGLGDLIHTHGGRYACEPSRLKSRNRITRTDRFAADYVAALPGGRMLGVRHG